MAMETQRTGELKILKGLLKDEPVVALLGLRQYGKTTLERQLFAKKPSFRVHYFDCELTFVDLPILAYSQ